MELTRRDAAAALAAVGATGGVTSEGNDEPLDETAVRASMAGVATVLYPSEVDGVEPFVDGFLDGRLDGSDHAEGVREAIGELDGAARSWHGAPITELSEGDPDRLGREPGLLREVGADTAEEDPDGTLAERVRYYVVNELLLALYASPTGGELVGLENPHGHPGGTESYRRGPR